MENDSFRQFVFSLARHVFHMPVRKLLMEIDSYELTEWYVYLDIERKEQEKESKRREAEAKSAPTAPRTF